MDKKTKRIGKQMTMLQELFDVLYEVMDQEGADPALLCYSAYSIETDLKNIVLGKLKAK